MQKLAGELDEPTMYGCAGDRPFLAGYGHTLDSFLEIVWKHGENDEAILKALQARALDEAMAALDISPARLTYQGLPFYGNVFQFVDWRLLEGR